MILQSIVMVAGMVFGELTQPEFNVYGPERKPKGILDWPSAVVTGCRMKNDLAFTFDDGIK